MASSPSSSSCKIKNKQRFSHPWKSSDLVLKVEGRKFYVHRAVLTVCSPVFETMFSSNFKEKSATEITLPEKKAVEIEQLLEGIYPDQDLWISKENYVTLLKLLIEYQIDRLKVRCEEFVSYWCSNDMTEDEAMELIILSQKYPLNERTVEGCVRKLACQSNQAWVEIKEHKLYSELGPAYVQWITEERMKYLEQKMYVGSPVYRDECHRKRIHEDQLLEEEKNLQKKRCFRL